MDLVIVGSMGYDDIETPVASGSDILGGSAVHAGVSASFHLPMTPEGTCRVGMVAPVGMDFSDSHQRKLEIPQSFILCQHSSFLPGIRPGSMSRIRDHCN